MKIMQNGDISSKISKFYDESTIYVPNKYTIVLYGDAVRNAVSVLNKSSKSNRQSYGLGKDTTHAEIDRESFERWYKSHYDPVAEHNGSKGSVHLKWACSNITVPTLDTMQSDNKIILDTFKNIKFDVISDYDATSLLTLTVTEEKGLMWYQFFNALSNQFFNAKALTPRDSFHKLSAVVTPLATNESSLSSTRNLKHDKEQDFEFNSIIYGGMGESITLSQDSTTPLSYKVQFSCPNPFQRSFKKNTSGMVNLASDSNYIIRTENGIKINSRIYESDYNNTLNL